MFGETVTRLRKVEGATDRYGNPTHTTVEAEIPGAAFAPEQDSQEPLEVGRTSVVTQPALYFYLSRPDLRSGDAVRVRGEMYEVDGKPADWRSPWGTSLTGLVVRLKMVTG